MLTPMSSTVNGTANLSAWRWLFILEGIPSCLSSILVYCFLPDYPETVHWLSVEEKALAAYRYVIQTISGSWRPMMYERTSIQQLSSDFGGLNWLWIQHSLSIEGSHSHGQNLTWTEARSVITEWRLYAHYAVSISKAYFRRTNLELDIFRHFDAIFESLTLHPQHNRWSWLRRAYISIDDSSTICCSLWANQRLKRIPTNGIRCGNSPCLLLCRPL